MGRRKGGVRVREVVRKTQMDKHQGEQVIKNAMLQKNTKEC